MSLNIQQELEILSANPILSKSSFKDDLARWTKVSDFVDENYKHLSTMEKAKLIGKILES